MTRDASPERDGTSVPRWVEHDRALGRLEDVLQALPLDRAVPDLADLLARAEATEDLVRRDERALKLLHEALLARPFGHLDVVARVRTEVELLTLEVELLTDRLVDRASARDTVVAARARLAEIQARLDELRDQI